MKKSKWVTIFLAGSIIVFGTFFVDAVIARAGKDLRLQSFRYTLDVRSSHLIGPRPLIDNETSLRNMMTTELVIVFCDAEKIRFLAVPQLSRSLRTYVAGINRYFPSRADDTFSIIQRNLYFKFIRIFECWIVCRERDVSDQQVSSCSISAIFEAASDLPEKKVTGTVTNWHNRNWHGIYKRAIDYPKFVAGFAESPVEDSETAQSGSGSNKRDPIEAAGYLDLLGPKFAFFGAVLFLIGGFVSSWSITRSNVIHIMSWCLGAIGGAIFILSVIPTIFGS